MNTIYESFNARNYSPEQVAKTFIASSEYQDLWRNEHTVVLGPRGSGKTTLFKMLTVQALYNWDSPIAAELRKERPFSAIYVPTDMHWHHQLRHASDALLAAPRFSFAASQAAVTTSILLAVSRTFQERIRYEAGDDIAREAELCELLISEWKMPKSLPCLELVVLRLKTRIAEIRSIINAAIYNRVTDDNSPEVPNYFHLDYLSCLDVACTAFDLIYRLDQSEKWALCLDELELAPTWLQQLAFSQQRSSEEKFLIKLSTSPIPKKIGTTESSPKQDLRLVCLWNHVGRRGDAFDEKIASAYLSRRLERLTLPEDIFGRSELVLQSEEGVGKYERQSLEWELFRRTASWDLSFSGMLQRSGVDPEDPITNDIAVRDSLLRKAKPIAILRNAFMKGSSEGEVFLRSRKVGSIYKGKEAIYRVADGNPRRLIGILNDLCAKLDLKSGATISRLSNSDQAEVLTRASLHFSGYIHSLPGGNALLESAHLDLTTLLKVIGQYFNRRLYSKDFPLDPVGSFIVDSNTNVTILELLRIGVYHGAIVHVDPVPDTIETSLKGKRFRLSYMLSPMHRLPLTLNDSVSLLTILRSSSRLRVRRALQHLDKQQELNLIMEYGPKLN